MGHACARPPDSVKSNNDQTTREQDLLEPIAVVGFSLKFPDDATSAESFWNMLIEGRCASEEFPKDRLNLDAFYDPNPDRQGTLPLRGGHFVHEDITTFDAPFFSITPAEAASMDPQQRGLLEVSYRAFENAGMPLDRVSGSKTSVHIGCFSSDQTVMNSRDPENISQYTAIGQAASMLSNRLSWFFDLNGPSLTLDTACSSSMVALDMACQALQTRQSDMGLVGGCNLMWCVDSTMALSNLGFLSHDSRCYSFDHRANGYARGEGFGIVVLKRVADAIRDGDIIRAVIRSTGSNQDGNTPGITLPSKDAQTRLINDTYQKAGLDMQMTNFFEAHGTGTPVGDPIEAYAIGNVFKHSRQGSDPLYIGAVKANIGHLEGASGMAGLIKTIMVLEKGIIPPNANYERLNPRIDAEFLNIQFPLECKIWPGNGLRRASINSFGFGGTNSHAVVDDAYNYLRLRNLPGKHRTVEKPTLAERLNGNSQLSCSESGLSHTNSAPSTLVAAPKLLVWSAADEGGLSRLSSCYGQHFSRLSLSKHQTTDYLENLAYTLDLRRSRLAWKSFAVVNSIAQLEDLKLSRPTQAIEHPRLAFIFTGQGAQWYAMGRELLIYPVFKYALRDTQKFFQSLGCDWLLFGKNSLWDRVTLVNIGIDELLKDERVSNIHEPKLSQPLCTALQMALVDLLRTFGINPAAVVGHSSGEIAAAYCSGALSRQSAWKVAYYRGILASNLAAKSQTRHTMMSVGLPEDQIDFYLKRVGHELGRKGLTISCINSPKNVTISGTEVQINALKAHLKDDNIFYLELSVNLAYHSPQMNEIAAEYLTHIEGLENGDSVTPERIKFTSSVTGQAISGKELCKAEYWVRNMISPVRFKEALENTCCRQNQEIRKKLDGSHRDIAIIHNILEIGPHSALRRPTRDTLQKMGRDGDIGYIAGLIRDRNAHETILEAVGCLYCLGYFVNLQAVNQPQSIPQDHLLVLPDLPEYPFDHSHSYFNESRLSRGHRFREQPRVELLGNQVLDWNPFEARWRNVLKLVEIPWAVGHQINGSVLFPAAGMLVMAIEAARQMSGHQKIRGFEIKDVTFNAPINLSLYPDGVETQFHLRSLKSAADKSNNWSEFRLYICEAGKWAETFCGLIQVEYEKSSTEVDEGLEATWIHEHYKELYDKAIQDCTKVANTRYVYHRLKEFGLDYGSAFQPLRTIRYSDSHQAIANLMLFSGSMDKNVVIHPTSLDGVLQLPLIALTKGGINTTPTTIPTRINRLWISNAGLCTPCTESIEVYASITVKGHRTTESSIFALDPVNNQLRIKGDGMETTAITHAEISANPRLEAKHVFYNLDWKPDITVCNERQLLDYCNNTCIPNSEPEYYFQDLALLLFSFIKKTSKELNEIKCTVSYLKNYITWMQLQLQAFDNGSLPHCRPEWNCVLDDPAYVDSMSKRLESTNKQGALYVKVGRNLTKILSGEVNPFEILFGGGLTKGLYEDLNESAQCFDKLAVYLSAYTHKNPAVKVLEVGAGTGTTTETILKTLGSHREQESSSPRYTQYDYTDISASSLDEAQALFAGHSRMKFGILNIEIDPSSQGFGLGSYDLIIAANVVHATKDIKLALQNIRKLLKIGGKLILVEVVRPDILRAGFAFGLLPEWWLSSEDYRSHGPCISEHKWHDVLKQTGFSGIDLEFRDFESDICHESSIMVSSATLAAATPPLSPTAPQSLVISQADSETLQRLSKELKARLEKSLSPCCNILFLHQAQFMTENIRDQCCIILEEPEHLILRDISPQNFNALKLILLSSRAVLWVTAGRQFPMTPDYGMVQGLARVLRRENSKLNFVTLALESKRDFVGQQMECIIKALSAMVHGPTDMRHEPEYIEKNGMLYISRLVEADYLNQDVFVKTSPQQPHTQKIKNGPPLRLGIGTPGLLDSFNFTEDLTHTHSLKPGEVEIEVKAIGINFLDCLIALGRVDMTTFGSECAGIITRVGDNCQLSLGDRVSLLSVDLFRTHARCMEDYAIKIPNHISFVEAAAIPVAFSTVYYGLYEVARAQKGETILIHSGAGGTGQAAIQIAQIIGLEIFVTVGSDEKKQLLIDMYKIPESHILYSRDLSFAQGIKRLTKRGVDIVLNSLAGEGLVASWECIAPYGRFIEIGKKDIYSHGMLPMFPFAANVSFNAIDLAFEPQNRPPAVRRSIENSFKLLASNKIHPPQPIHEFGLSEVEKAFRYLQSGKNTGKTVIKLDPDTEIPMLLEPKPDYSFDANATYLIAGGLGGLGRCIARWMVRRGTSNLLLLSRSGPGPKAQALLDELRLKGARVETPICDVTDTSSIVRMLDDYRKILPPIKGCIQCSMVLKDATFETMSINDWEACIRPKVQGSWNLHALLPKKMDFFILLSSISGIIGNGGQANYAAGNAYQDALARYRVALGEKAAALDLGALMSEGFLAENASSLSGAIRDGILPPMSETELLALLDYHCNPSLDVSSQLKCQAVTGIEIPANIRTKGTEVPYWLQQPLFRQLHQISGTATSHSVSQEQALDFAAVFAATPSLSEAAAIVSDALAKKLSRVMGFQPEHIDSSKPMSSYGVDSLVAVELRNWFSQELSADTAIFEILSEPSIFAVGMLVARKSQYRQASWTE